MSDASPAIDFRETATAVRCWFAGWAGEMDWSCVLYRLPDGDGVLEYRFRYYEDERIEDSADRKTWTLVPARRAGEPGLADLASAGRSLLRVIRECRRTADVVEEIEITDGDVIAALAGRPWAHVTRIDRVTGQAGA